MRYYNAIIYFMSLFRPSVYLGRLKTCWLRCFSFVFSVMKLPFLPTTLTLDVCWKKHLFCCIDSLLFYFRHTASHKMMKFPLKTGKKRCLFKELELLKPSICFCNLYIYLYLFIYLLWSTFHPRGHFTVAGLVSQLLKEIEAEVGLVLIQTSFLSFLM